MGNKIGIAKGGECRTSDIRRYEENIGGATTPNEILKIKIVGFYIRLMDILKGRDQASN